MGNPYAPPPPRQDGAPPRPPAPRRGAARPDGGGQAPPPEPPPEPTPQDVPSVSPEQLRAASRRVLGFGVATTGALVVTALPLPWQALGVVFSALALVLGVRAVRAVWATPLRRSLLPVLLAGFAIAGLYLMTTLTVVATWPIQQARQDCLGRALTVSARDACEADFRQALEERLNPAESSATP